MDVRSPEISIILPIHNMAVYLPACLESLLFHQGNRLEVVAINDGSIDDSQQMLETFSKRSDLLKIFTLPENRGVSAARNFGMGMARGTYVLFVDADDRLIENAVPILLRLISKYSPDIIQFQYRSVTENGDLLEAPSLLRERFFNLAESHEYREVFDYAACHLLAWNGCYRRQAIRDLCFQPYSNGEDVLFGVQAFCCVKTFLAYPGVLYEYVHRKDSASHSKTMQHCISTIEVGVRIFETFHKMPIYGLIRDLLFRQIRWQANGMSLGVLNSLCLGERGICWKTWFDRFGPVFCSTDIVPCGRRWLYRAVFRMRNPLMVQMFLRFPLRVTQSILSIRGLRKKWIQVRRRLFRI